MNETEDLGMKRTFGIILAICLLVGLVPVSYAQEPIEINIYHHMSSDTARGQATEKILEMFNEEYEGIYKAVADVNPDFPTYQEKVKAMIAANETPDIFCYTYNPNDLSRQNSGRLMDLMPYMDDEWRARFNQSDLDLLTIDGKLYSLPRAQQAAVFYYNEELLSEAGYDHFPTTWDEFFECAEALKENGVAAISLYTADDAWYATCLLTYVFASLAGNELANSGTIECDEMVQAAEYLQKAFAYTTSDAVGANYSVSSSNFFNGKTAIVIDGPWMIGSIPEDMVDKIKVGVAPSFGDGKVAQNYLVTDAQAPWAAAVQEDPAKAEAVVTLLKYLTNEESTKIYTLEGSEYQSAKLNLTEEDLESMNSVQREYYNVYSAGEESIVNVQRNLSTAANAALPSLVESLVLGEITAEEFVSQLAAENNY